MSDKAEPEAAKKPILDRLPPILRPFAIVLFTIIILPVLILIKLIILPFEKPIERSGQIRIGTTSHVFRLKTQI